MVEKKINKDEGIRQWTLKVALETFARDGFWGARMDKIAESAGVNKRKVYELFRSKEELYKGVLELAVEVFEEKLSDVVDFGLNFRKRIEQSVRWYIGIYKGYPLLSRLISWEFLKLSPERSTLLKSVSAFDTRFRGLISDAEGEDLIRGDVEDLDIYLVAFCIVSLCFAFGSRSELLKNYWGVDTDDKEVEGRFVNMLLSFVESALFKVQGA